MNHDHAATIQPRRATTPLLTTVELAAELKIPPKSISKMAARGVLPGYKVGRLWRFKLDEVLRACRVESPGAEAERRLRGYRGGR